MPEEIFDSFSDPIPPFRHDVQIIPVKQNGASYVYFYDQLGYASSDFALPFSSQTILSLLDGNRSVNDILKFSNNGISAEEVLDYVRFLDKNALLYSDYLKSRAEEIESQYEQSDVHHSNTAGISYPEDAEELALYLDEAFKEISDSESVSDAKALYAPHIDPRVGLKSYVEAFSAIRNLKPKRVVILATSHYSGYYPDYYEEHPFVISRKNFKMANGEVKTDREAIDQLREISGVTLHDRAHRIEHSIEMHLLFLNHIWKHDFKIVPVLVGGFDELFYMKNGHRGEQLRGFASKIRETFSDEETFFLISGDLAHFGRKFGDQKAAEEMFDDVRAFDHKFLKAGEAANADSMLQLMSEKYDTYRICGFPPLFTFINAFSHLKGKILNYDIWDETERDSAVSFGSIVFRSEF